MFILSLQKRHPDSEVIRELATDLLQWFSIDMPIESPIQLDNLPPTRSPSDFGQPRAQTADAASSPRSPQKDNALMLPELVKRPGDGSRGGSLRPPFSPTTTISALYVEAPSPYSSTRLPITRPPTSPVEQSRRAMIYSTPKLDAVDGERRRRCKTPYMSEEKRQNWSDADHAGSDSLPGSPLPSPDAGGSPKKKIAISDKYSWNPECINSVSGFEWWWRSLPQNHSSLEPTQKLKAVTKAAVRMHTRGELEKAIELYELALSSDINAEVEFRLRINLACAFEAAHDLPSSVEQFRRAMQLNPEDSYAKYKLGDVLVASGGFDEARQLYEAILNVYPQAADALSALELAEKAQLEKEQSERAAIAAAKAPRVKDSEEKPVESKIDATPTPPRSGKKAAGPRAVSTRPQKSSEPSLDSPKSTASVGTDTMNVESSQSLGDTLALRCREARVDLIGCFARMDVQNRGVIRSETFAALIQMLCGVDFAGLSEDTLRAELNVFPGDLDTSNSCQKLFHYGNFLSGLLSHLERSPSSISDVQKGVDALVSDEVGFISAAIESLVQGEVPSEADHKGPREADVTTIEGTSAEIIERTSESEEAKSATKEQLSHTSDSNLQTHLPSTNSTPRLFAHDGRSPSATSLVDTLHSERSVFDTIVDGYTSLSPRMDDKREKMREVQILKAEKARVLARKHMHCLKSLRDIATRARKHLRTRRLARAFLIQVAQEAQRAILSRYHHSQVAAACAAVVDAVAAGDNGGDADLGRAVADASADTAEADENVSVVVSAQPAALAAQMYADAVGAALGRILGSSDVERLQSLARQYAADYCRVSAGRFDEQQQQ